MPQPRRASPPKARRPFVAVDGESYTIDGEHRYVLLMDSNRRHIYNPAGIGTRECFEYLLDLPRKTIPVAFGLNYDANMIFRDFGRSRIAALWEEGKTCWYDYEVEWIPGKWLRLTHGAGKSKRTVKINETFGFFQSSFVKALEAWRIDFQDSDELEAMKLERGAFDEGMTERVIDYCHTECVQLVRLMNELRTALEAVDINLTSWNGAGSVAATLLRKHGVLAHHVPHTDLPKEIQHAALSAYFGGRTELFKQGEFDTVTEYDIASAYPYAALSLPSLLEGSWQATTTVDPDPQRTAIYEVAWSLPDDVRVAPFPYRYKGSRICYPLNGRGWYHHAEVAAALLHHPDHVHVLGGWEFSPSGHAGHPFDFIRELFAYRKQLKSEGHAGEKCIKLGINSVYGKLAQGVGYKGKLPPFQSYVWAGQITSMTRARMFNLAMENPANVLMLATDAIFYDGVVHQPTGTDLGSLERVDLQDVFLAQPGVYRATPEEPAKGWHPPLRNEIKRSRGFFAKEIDFNQLIAGYHAEGPHFIGRYSSTRFVGAGTALMARDMTGWRKWVTKDRKLTLYPSTKRLDQPDLRPCLHTPPRLAEPVLPSAPYRPKLGGYLDEEKEYAQGREQPMRS